MKKYDFISAKVYIDTNVANIKEATLGIFEDWFWTASTVYENGEYLKDLTKLTEIAGISGSGWATPALLILNNDGTEEYFSCFVGESTGEGNPGIAENLGVLSAPVQKNIAKKTLKVLPKYLTKEK